MNLVFRSMTVTNFGPFIGSHTFSISTRGGFFYVTGVNKSEPSLGANGVGKSTIWNALLWALYGRTVQDSRPGAGVVPWSNYKHNGSTVVTVRLERDGRVVTISRSRKPNHLHLNGDEVEQDAIIRAIGISEDVFLRAVLIGQKSDLFLDMLPEKQSQLFTDVLDLDLWLRGAKAAADMASEADDAAADFKANMDKLEGRLAEVKAQRARERKAETSFAEELREKVEGERKALRWNEESLVTLRAKLPTMPVRFDLTTEAENALDEEIEKTRQKISRVAEDVAVTRSQRTDQVTRQQEARDSVKTYSEALAGERVCPECGQTVSISHIKKKLALLERAVLAYSESIRTATEEIEAGKKLHGELSSQLTVKTKFKEDVASAREAFREVQAEHSDNVAEFKATIKAQRGALETLKRQKNPHGALVHELDDQLDELELKLRKVKRAYQTAQRRAEQARYWVGAFKEIRLGLIEETLAELDIATNAHAEGLGLKGWQIKFSTTRESAGGSISTKFSAYLYPPKETDPIAFTTYSGGEGQRWQLAVAFGLGEVLLARAGLQTNLLILDEPTQHLSQEGVDDLLSYLSDLAKENKKSVYLVDQMMLDRGIFDDVIVVEKTAAGACVVNSGVVPVAVPITMPRKRLARAS